MLVGGGLQVRGRIKRRKKWDNCNSIVKKIYLQNFIYHLRIIGQKKGNADIVVRREI